MLLLKRQLLQKIFSLYTGSFKEDDALKLVQWACSWHMVIAPIQTFWM